MLIAKYACGHARSSDHLAPITLRSVCPACYMKRMKEKNRKLAMALEAKTQ